MSRTTSSPSTVASPRSGRSNVTRMRKSVVLPPPSGPMNPNSSPRSISNDTLSSARVSPHCFRRLLALTELDIDGHPELEQPFAVVDADFDRVDEIRAFVARLHRRRRELRFAGDPRDRAGKRLTAFLDVQRDRDLLADLHRCELR